LVPNTGKNGLIRRVKNNPESGDNNCAVSFIEAEKIIL
jgi:hypothetical protein